MLQRTGFFSSDNQRGEMPEEWAKLKTEGDAVMLCQVYNKAGESLVAKSASGTKMKTFTFGAEVVKFDLDPANVGQEQAKDNLRQYLYLFGKYGSYDMQRQLAYTYDNQKLSIEAQQEGLRAKEHLRRDPNPLKIDARYTVLYVPCRPMPFKLIYPATGPRPEESRFSNFALHHNISFEKLKLFWNFANAYSKSTGDRNPQVDMMVNMYGIPRPNASHWANSFSSDTSPGSDVLTTLFDRVTWRGWNLVEGPASDRRHDDPAEKFDNFNVTAMPESRRSRLAAVAALSGVIDGIETQLVKDGLISNMITINMANAVFGANYSLLVPGMRAAMAGIDAIQDQGFIAFNPQLWIYSAEGREVRFRIRRP